MVTNSTPKNLMYTILAKSLNKKESNEYVYWLDRETAYVVVRNRWGAWFHPDSKYRADLIEIKRGTDNENIISYINMSPENKAAAKYFGLEEIKSR